MPDPETSTEYWTEIAELYEEHGRIVNGVRAASSAEKLDLSTEEKFRTRLKLISKRLEELHNLWDKTRGFTQPSKKKTNKEPPRK